MPTLKRIIEESDTPAGKAFDLGVQGLIVLSLVTFSLETLPFLSDTSRRLLSWFEVFCIGIFTVEYLARLVVADNWRKFVFSFFGLVDLAAILPFYLFTGLDLRSLRAFRFLRLVRILKLVRYSIAAQRFHRAFLAVREELVLFFLVTLILMFLASVGIYYFEHQAQPDKFASIFHCLWWALTTLTTVGYGDMYPVTAGGRVFTFFVLLIGLGTVAVPTAIMASALSRAREEDNCKAREASSQEAG